MTNNALISLLDTEMTCQRTIMATLENRMPQSIRDTEEENAFLSLVVSLSHQDTLRIESIVT